MKTDKNDNQNNLEYQGRRNNAVPENNLVFHYNREERLSRLRESQRPKKFEKKIFRKNRSLQILFADIILILILTIGYFIYIKISTNSASNSGYNFNLNSYIFDDNILISLVIKNTSTKISVGVSASGAQEAAQYKAVITMADNPAFYKNIFDTLPDEPGKEIVVRISATAVPDGNNSFKKSVINAVIEFNNQTIRLKCTPKSEK